MSWAERSVSIPDSDYKNEKCLVDGARSRPALTVRQFSIERLTCVILDTVDKTVFFSSH